MTENPIPITSICDFLFCPYSCYLHNIYSELDVNVYHSFPQKRGVIVHETIDNRTLSNDMFDIQSLTVYSDRLGIIGKIDLYNTSEKLLVEYKYKIADVEGTNILQIWMQYLCMKEMGFDVERLALYEHTTSTYKDISLPSEEDIRNIISIINDMRNYDPISTEISINTNKCRHCIYTNMCNKTSEENVYN